MPGVSMKKVDGNGNDKKVVKVDGKLKASYPCRVCGGRDYSALAYMVCDTCIMKAAKMIEEIHNICHPECGPIKIDLDHYPVDEHAEFYGIEWHAYDCTCGGKPEEEGVWVRKNSPPPPCAHPGGESAAGT